MKNIKLTNCQEHAFQKFLSFLEDSSYKAFILKGYAGTGKTTLTKQFIDELVKRELPFSLLASTGRAAKILTNATNYLARTVHSEIYTFSDLNQDLEKIANERETMKIDSTGQLYLNFELLEKKSTRDELVHFYLVDEASMVSDKEDKSAKQALFGSGRLLYDLIMHDPLGRFIFIGDKCQLPPVTQNISPALDADYLKEVYGISVLESELTQIVRQEKANGIVVAAQKLRELYHHPQTNKWASFPLRGYNNIHIFNAQTDLINKYINVVKKEGFNAATLLCVSNKETNALTKILRPSFGHLTPYLEKGDLLLVTQNNLLTGLLNGDLVVVEEVSIKERRAGLTFLRVTVREMFSEDSHSLLMIAEVLYGNLTNITQTQHKDLLMDFYYRMRKCGIKQKSFQFNEMMREDPYLNALRAVYGYALTCHKAQGGEWENVFLDIHRSLPAWEKPGVYQWVYTAVTRARKELYTVDGFWVR